MISIAKAELKRLRENRKLTMKGRKNRTPLLEECRVISSAEVVNYMEKKKAQPPKLKRITRNRRSKVKQDIVQR